MYVWYVVVKPQASSLRSQESSVVFALLHRLPANMHKLRRTIDYFIKFSLPLLSAGLLASSGSLASGR